MKTIKTKKINCILLGILLVLALLVGGLVVSKRVKIRNRNAEFFAATVSQEHEKDIDFFEFCEFAEKARKEEEQRENVKQDDLMDLKKEKYDYVQISMWNDDVCSCEWFEYYFGQKLFNPKGMFETPQELRECLEVGINSGNTIVKFFLCLDPDELEKNYYEECYYDSEQISYEEYISQYIIPYMSACEEVEFCFILPHYSVSYLATLSQEDLFSKFDNWYKFMMYLHWCSNATVSYLGAEDWLVAKDSNYISKVNFEEDIEKLAYLYEYAFDEYTINGPEFLEKRKLLEKYIDDYKNGAYDWKGLQGEKVVFLGDSIFDYAGQRNLCIPSYFGCFTNTVFYNLSRSGSLASNNGTCSFCEISEKILKKEYISEEGKNYKDYKRFLDECDSQEKLLFVINYGFNDYFNGVKIYDEENPGDKMTYRGALHECISSLKLAYPNSNFVILSPYLTKEGSFGTKPFSDYGGILEDYIEAAGEQAEIEGAKFINMYDAFNVTKENMGEYLVDGVHPDYSQNIKFARLIYEGICE